MSAIVCGKRSYFEELAEYSSTPVSKKLRCSSSSSPIRFSPFSRSSLVDKLMEAFPLMDRQVLERTLEECGDDIDAAIKRLHELCIGSSEEGSGSANRVGAQVEQEQSAPIANSTAQNSLPKDGNQWVELFVNEMMSSSSVDDARMRAAKVLEVLEKSVREQATAEVADNYRKENIMLKQQIQALMNDNNILKRGIQIQHERQKDFDVKNQEVEQLKQMLSQYQEQLTKLEMTNYNLSWHLKQAQPSGSIPGHFNPDVF